MKRWPNITVGGLSLLTLGVLAVALALLFEGLRGTTRLASPVFPSPIETTIQPPSPPPPTPVWPTPPAAPVPPCTFGEQPAPMESEYPLEAYQFSEPRVVLTHPAGIEIAGWLPDGRRLLIARDVPGKHRQTIDVLDIETGELITYAEREGSPGRPVWLSALNGVAYLTSVAEEAKEPPTSYRLELWVSYGSPPQAERLAMDADGPLVADPDGRRLWYFLRSEPDRLQLYDVETRSLQGTLVDLAPLRYLKPGLEWAMEYRSTFFQVARRIDGSQVLFYSQFWTFLLDVRSGRWCELEVGEYEQWMKIPPWPLQARWSPDGRYVAFVTTDTLDTRLLSTWLTILNVETGERRTLSPGPDIEPGRHYVSEVAWSPDSRYLVALAAVRMEEGFIKDGLFLVNAATGESRRVLPEYEFGGGWYGTQLAWDPSGSFLAVYCPTLEEGRLCIVSVSPNGVEEKHP